MTSLLKTLPSNFSGTSFTDIVANGSGLDPGVRRIRAVSRSTVRIASGTGIMGCSFVFDVMINLDRFEGPPSSADEDLPIHNEFRKSRQRNNAVCLRFLSSRATYSQTTFVSLCFAVSENGDTKRKREKDFEFCILASIRTSRRKFPSVLPYGMRCFLLTRLPNMINKLRFSVSHTHYPRSHNIVKVTSSFPIMMSRFLIVLVALLGAASTMTSAFAPAPSGAVTRKSTTAAFIFGKKQEEDLSFIETRDMTRAEMEDLNRQNEEIMNMELSMMTGFSLVISLPILYLCWVAFFSD